MTDDELAGKVAYTAYGTDAAWKTYDDKPMPTWQELRPDTRAHWIAAAVAVREWQVPDGA